MSTAGTRDAILDAAETLFAEHGFAATSLRQLTRKAGVNLAAVHYHFGGKEELARAALVRRLEPINTDRLRRLDRAEAPRRPTARAIVHAFLAPAVLGAEGVANVPGELPAAPLCRLFGRLHAEQPPFLRPFLAEQFRGVGDRFARAMAAAVPQLQPATLWWRLFFLDGAMVHVLQNATTLHELTGGRCDATDLPALLEQLVEFTTAGLTARDPQARPAPRRRPSRTRR